MSSKAAKKPMSNKKFTIIWGSVLAVVLVIAVVANVALSIYGKLVETQLGTGTYAVENVSDAENWDLEYDKADYSSLDEAMAASAELVEEIASEGIVLLKNESDALPLTGTNVTMLGRDAADPVYGGSGSGSVDVSTAVTALVGLENVGYLINETVYEQLESFASENARGSIFMDNAENSSYQIAEMPANQYDSVADSFKDYADAALVFIGRPGGEGGDLTTDMEGWDDNYTDGQHQLELNQDGEFSTK